MYWTIWRQLVSPALHVGSTKYRTKNPEWGFRFLSKPKQAAENWGSFVGQLYYDLWNVNFNVGQLETRNSLTSDKYLPNNIQKEIRARWNLVTFMAFTSMSLQGLSFTANSEAQWIVFLLGCTVTSVQRKQEHRFYPKRSIEVSCW